MTEFAMTFTLMHRLYLLIVSSFSLSAGFGLSLSSCVIQVSNENTTVLFYATSEVVWRYRDFAPSEVVLGVTFFAPSELVCCDCEIHYWRMIQRH